MDLLQAFVTEVRREALAPAGSRVLVACSGGGDSTALAVLAAEARQELGIADLALAHLDHALRAGSGADAEAVVQLAERLELPLESVRTPVRRKSGESPEAAARGVRYRFLREAAAARSSTVVMTGHTADDQAETVLHRILRGTGLRGLAGIPACRQLAPGIVVARPLLSYRRAELRDFLRDRGVAWRDDPTNRHGNERARLRHRALPVLAETAGRDPVPLLTRLARNAAAARGDLLDVARRFVRTGRAGVELLPGHEHLPRGALRWALGEVAGDLRDRRPLSRAESGRLLRALLGEPHLEQVPGLHVVPGPRGACVVVAGSRPLVPAPVALPVPGRAGVPWTDLGSIAVYGERELHLAPHDAELVDRDTLHGPLTIRIPEPGERFVPLGGGPVRRVRSLLGKRGVPATRRAGYPVVADADGVVVLPGVTLADRVKVTAATTRRLAIGATPLDR